MADGKIEIGRFSCDLKKLKNGFEIYLAKWTEEGM